MLSRIRPLTLREKKKFRILGGNSNPKLVQRICRELKVEPIKAEIGNFPDEETKIDIMESIRGTIVFVIQSTCRPANQNLMELAIMIDALKRASAYKVVVVMPYYGYARQDRKSAPRAPLTAKLVADILTKAAGAHKFIILDLHAGQIEGCFDNDHPVNPIYIRPIFLKDIKSVFPNLSPIVAVPVVEKTNDIEKPNAIMVTPDAGGSTRARAFAKRLGLKMAQIDKRKEEPLGKRMNLIGEVAGLHAIILDDIVDTAGTLVEAAETLVKNGALSVRAYSTHPVLSEKAVQRIVDSPLEELVVSNSIPLSPEGATCQKIRVLGVERLLAATMVNVFRDNSVSDMLEAF